MGLAWNGRPSPIVLCIKANQKGVAGAICTLTHTRAYTCTHTSDQFHTHTHTWLSTQTLIHACTLLLLRITIINMYVSGHSGRKIHNRWLVAYTLVRNPSLIPLTASNLEAANMKKRLYDHEVKSDVDNDEKVTLESVKVDLSDLDNIKQERDIGTNL